MDFSVLPLPVARLARRGFNAKSAKDRHDAAYFALELSVRLAVAAAPPGDATALARASVGTWVEALDVGGRSLSDPALLALHAHWQSTLHGRRSSAHSVAARELLTGLAAYRNRTIGHGSLQPAGFYERAAPILLDAIPALWRAGVFMPPGVRLVYAESVEVDGLGRRRARLLDLEGDAVLVIDPAGTPVADDVLPRRLYREERGVLRSLYPWALYLDETEEVFCFNGLGRRAELLDFASGRRLRGDELEARFPGAEAGLRRVFGEGTIARESLEAPSTEDASQRFGDFRLLGKLGEGGMGAVYLAWQASLSRHVALKVLPASAASDPVAAARFRREVRALSRCDHPNVVKILTYGEERGVPYYAMEYVPGADLSRVAPALAASSDFRRAVSTASAALRTEQRAFAPDLPELPPVAAAATSGRDRFHEVARFVRDAAQGVHHLHERGILHRDLKPANLMASPPDGRAVVMDLGLALLADASVGLTRSQEKIVGTLRYMAPEQLQSNLLSVDRRADVYGLGATLHELLSDRPLFDGDSEARLIEQVLREDPPSLRRVVPGLPVDLATIARKATEKDPRLRYENAAQLASDLDAFLEGRPIQARDPGLGYVLSLAVKRHRGVAAALALALLAIVAGATAFAIKAGQATRAARLATAEAGRADAMASEALIRTEEAMRSARDARAQAYRSSLSMAELALASGRPSDADYWIEQCPEELRGWEWGHLDFRLDPSLYSIPHRSPLDPVRSIEFDSTGERLIAGFWDGSIKLWCAEDGTMIHTVQAPSPVKFVVYSPDDSEFASVHADGTIRLWDTSTGCERLVVSGHSDIVWCVAYSPDGRSLASASRDGTVRVWESATGRQRGQIYGHAGGVESVKFSTDGRRLLSGSTDGTVREWDAETYESLRVLEASRGEIWSVSYSHNDRWIAAGGTDHVLRIWNRRSGELAVEAEGHTDTIESVSFSDDDAYVLSGSHDGSIRQWSVSTGAEQGIYRARRSVKCLAVNAASRLLASGSVDGTLTIWAYPPVASEHRQRIPSKGSIPLGCIAVSELSNVLAVATGLQIHVFELSTLAPIRVIGGLTQAVNTLRLSGNGRVLVTGLNERLIQKWNPLTGELLDQATLQEPSSTDEEIHAIAVSHDGQTVAAIMDGAAHLWIAETRPRTLPQGARALASAELTADGRFLFAGSEDGEITKWRVDTGECLRTIRHHDEVVFGLSLIQGERQLASASLDGRVVLSDVVTGRSTRVLTELNAGTARAGLLRRGALLSVAVDKAATRVFAGGVDGVLRIWDFERGELLYSLHAGEEFLIASIQLDLTHGRLLVWALEESLSGAGCEVIVWPTKRDDMGMYADALQQLTK